MNTSLDIVITMGGLGSRFRKMGYQVPKYMIEAKGRTLFEWSMLSLDGFKNIAQQYIFIVMEDKKEDVKAFICQKCEEMNIEKYHVIVIDYLTDGQATTAMLAKKYWNKQNGLLIYNIDTYVEAGAMNSEQLHGDGFIPCFHAEGDHWSFVCTDNQGKVTKIKEKERISDNCTLGAYYFRSCEHYAELYREYYEKEQELIHGEKYVAPLYEYMIDRKEQVYISIVNSEKVHVLGTPEELEVFLKS